MNWIIPVFKRIVPVFKRVVPIFKKIVWKRGKWDRISQVVSMLFIVVNQTKSNRAPKFFSLKIRSVRTICGKFPNDDSAETM